MTINVYAWPPVAVIGRSWQVTQPTASLRSALTGKDQRQSSQRARRMVSLEVSARARNLGSAGYMEMLGQLLAGGEHAVRITSWSPNPCIGRRDFEWLSIGLTATATTSAGFDAWQVSGLPPGFPLIGSGERFKVGSTVYQAVNSAVANASGVAVIRVIGSTTGSGSFVTGQNETAVFRHEGEIPTGLQSGSDWSYAWQFREVFADEVGGFTEVNPWI